MQFKKFGKYSVIKKVASGGMADILLSISLSPTGFGRFVVIKKALAKFSDNQDFNEMFKNEAKVACNLKHKNITPIYEFGVEKEQFFLTMEYILGKNLREITKKIASQKKEIGIDNAIYIIKEVASGLNYAHNAIDSNTGLPLNIIHRDVSPQNIMISFDGDIKLIDFGIAKIADTNLTKAGHLKGKFSYMSPEQAQGDKIDERTDIFCLGIILWELLTGKRLFASENEMASLKKVRNCNIPSPQKINPKIPTELNDIVMKSLSKNKNLRYKTASRFERDLNVFLNKNYPEYSHYNLTFLIKTIYRKEVMQEREKLKIYSSEFKKYLNALNLEKSLSSTQINFKTIEKDDSRQPASKQDGDNLVKTKTKSVLRQNTQESLIPSETQSENMDSSFVPSEEFSQRSTQSETTFQIQNQTNSSRTRTGNNEEPSQLLEDSLQIKPLDLKANTSSKRTDNLKDQSEKVITDKLEINKLKIQDINQGSNSYQTSYTINTNLTKSASLGSLLTSKNNYIEDKLSMRKKKRRNSLFLRGFASLLFLALIAGSYFFYFKDSSDTKKPVVGFNEKSQDRKTAEFKKQPVKKTQLQPTTASKRTSNKTASRNPQSQKKKIFLRSRPSNAGIYVNNKFISKYTPSVMTLDSNKQYFVIIKKPGYLSKSFQIKPGRSQNSIDIQLTRKNSSRRNSVLIVE